MSKMEGSLLSWLGYEGKRLGIGGFVFLHSLSVSLSKLAVVPVSTCKCIHGTHLLASARGFPAALAGEVTQWSCMEKESRPEESPNAEKWMRLRKKYKGPSPYGKFLLRQNSLETKEWIEKLLFYPFVRQMWSHSSRLICTTFNYNVGLIRIIIAISERGKRACRISVELHGINKPSLV